MAENIRPEIETNPDTLANDAYDYITDRWPNWEPHDGNLEAWLIEALARMAAELRDVAADVPVSIFRHFGQSLLGVVAQEATQAQAVTTWTAVDNAGYTIPAGTLVGVAVSGNESLAFETLDEVVILPVTLSVSGVIIEAVEPGAESSGLNGATTLIDSLNFVAGISLDGETAGGVDGEPDDVYLNRLASKLQLLSPRPILAEDAAILAQGIPGVDRATTIDNYNPTTGTFGNERMVTVAIIDVEGEPVSGAIKAEVDAMLQAQREVNFIFHVIDPVYTVIGVTYNATAYPGFEPEEVRARADVSLQEYLSPKAWGLPPFGESREWLNDTKVRINEAIEALQRTDGLRYVNSLTLNGAANDVQMAGAVSMPRAGAINGVVVA